MLRKVIEEFVNLDCEEGDVILIEAIGFSVCSFDAIVKDVAADADFVGEGLGVGSEEVTVTATNFESESLRFLETVEKLFFDLLLTLVDVLEKFLIAVSSHKGVFLSQSHTVVVSAVSRFILRWVCVV